MVGLIVDPTAQSGSTTDEPDPRDGNLGIQGAPHRAHGRTYVRAIGIPLPFPDPLPVAPGKGRCLAL